NNGLIELTDVTSAYGAALIVTSGTLVNPAGDTIRALAGTAGPRTINAELGNQGVVLVGGAQGLTLSKTGAAHGNSGTIDVTGGNLNLNQAGTTPSFTNAGTLTVGAGRTLTVTNGAFTQQAGATLAGGGTVTLNSVTAALNTAVTLAALNLNSTTA